MPNQVIGPGRQCVQCSGTYGQHTPECSYWKSQEFHTIFLGRKFREAIEQKDDLALGKLLVDLGKR